MTYAILLMEAAVHTEAVEPVISIRNSPKSRNSLWVTSKPLDRGSTLPMKSKGKRFNKEPMINVPRKVEGGRRGDRTPFFVSIFK